MCIFNPNPYEAVAEGSSGQPGLGREFQANQSSTGRFWLKTETNNFLIWRMTGISSKTPSGSLTTERKEPGLVVFHF